jgi:assimilatory nitrate reductase catalytic subunit
LSWTWSGERTEPPKLDAYKLRLVVGRKLYDAGVMLSMSPSLTPLASPPVLRLHPSDLERLGVPSGGQVRVRSSKMTIEAIEVEADAHQPRGTAGVPFNVPGLDTGSLLSADATVAEIAVETLS